jgi:hypothetical protein
MEAEALGLAAATELKLASWDERLPAIDERTPLAELCAEAALLEAAERAELAAPAAELATEPALPVAELAAEAAAEVIELRTEDGTPTRADEAAPRAEERRSPPWAAAPAARKVVATMEKRILMVLCWVGMW